MGESAVAFNAADGVVQSENAGESRGVSFEAGAWSGLLEPLVQQVAVSLRERCGVRGGDPVRYKKAPFYKSLARLLCDT